MIGFILVFLLIAMPFGIAGTDIKFASQLSGLILMGIIFYVAQFVWAILTSWITWVVVGLLVAAFLYWIFFKLEDAIN